MIDLHTHTTFSDGSMTPAELVGYAKLKGLKAVAVTDHDTASGLPEAGDEGKKLGIEVVQGVEISVDFNPEMHILGYFLDGDYTRIEDTLANLRKRRRERNPKIIKKLNEMGMDISMKEVAALASGGNIGRPHIAKILTDKGYAKSERDAFDRYLGSGRPAYFKKEKLTPEQGILEIVLAGGLPVLAHPIYLNMKLHELDELLIRLMQSGLKGIEAYYADNTEEQTRELLELADSHGLVVTGGSDFHGSYRPDIDIGTGRGNLRVPDILLEKLLF